MKEEKMRSMKVVISTDGVGVTSSFVLWIPILSIFTVYTSLFVLDIVYSYLSTEVRRGPDLVLWCVLWYTRSNLFNPPSLYSSLYCCKISWCQLICCMRWPPISWYSCSHQISYPNNSTYWINSWVSCTFILCVPLLLEQLSSSWNCFDTAILFALFDHCRTWSAA